MTESTEAVQRSLSQNTQKVLTPDNFDEYLRWACTQHQMSRTAIITRVQQNEYVSAHSERKEKGKAKKAIVDSIQSDESHSLQGKKDSHSPINYSADSIVNIYTIYDANNKLVEIRFQDNPKIPRQILIIFSMIAKFHPYLTTIKINKGLDGYVMHELRKLLNVSNITEVCLDGTYLATGNYHSLLEPPCVLKHLSLKGCRIDDGIVKNITDLLCYPNDAAKHLYILNLATNRITNVGAKYISEMLRTNRTLAYLNLCNNQIEDTGAIAIFNTLLEFRLSSQELAQSRARLVKYLNDRSNLITRLIGEMKFLDEKNVARKKMKVSPKVKVEKESSVKSVLPLRRSVVEFYRDKAMAVAENMMGEFDDPFLEKDVMFKNHYIYSKGNNTLAYLNIGYNNLSFISIKTLLDVVSHQRIANRTPRGLVNINIDGNFLPRTCLELVIINDILNAGLMVRHGSTISKKKFTKK